MVSLPINLFDCLFVATLAAGIVIGRKHGLSEELFRALKWIFLVLLSATLYRPLGNLIAVTGFFDVLSSNVMGYLGLTLVGFLVFSILQRRLAAKLVGSDAFGRGEYYLGMGSGLVRYACMMVMLLALLNARAFTPTELQRMEQYQEQAYGSNLFPTLHSLQQAVFEDSLTGTVIKNHLGFLLISATEAETAALENSRAVRPATR